MGKPGLASGFLVCDTALAGLNTLVRVAERGQLSPPSIY
jgi:hypothetical protein